MQRFQFTSIKSNDADRAVFRQEKLNWQPTGSRPGNWRAPTFKWPFQIGSNTDLFGWRWSDGEIYTSRTLHRTATHVVWTPNLEAGPPLRMQRPRNRNWLPQLLTELLICHDECLRRSPAGMACMWAVNQRCFHAARMCDIGRSRYRHKQCIARWIASAI